MSANIVHLCQYCFCLLNPSPLSKHFLHPRLSFFLLSSTLEFILHLLLLLLRTKPNLYYCTYVNRTPPRALLLLFLSVNDVKQHDRRGGGNRGSEPLARPHAYLDAQPHTDFLLTQQNTHTKSRRGCIIADTHTRANCNRLDMMRSPERPETSRQLLHPRRTHTLSLPVSPPHVKTELFCVFGFWSCDDSKPAWRLDLRPHPPIWLIFSNRWCKSYN